jgi:hypothetical protein
VQKSGESVQKGLFSHFAFFFFLGKTISRPGGMYQVVQHLSNKSEALSSNPVPSKIKKSQQQE